ncbi:DUF2537 domain-containing protein [Actinosynnema pretiosum subsp. pretiosum]|uniref:DUF2537 domain-containing protein n=2 Tax=Actinosynnema TaxID=40566 RepID=C6WI13_ACTMD|nr:DUF2537 domain-containing protein [Actinosynnema mirum]ACU34464.1 hypothetical protein Amir_0497 [Actinosynnema mirum DSM 43827]AXX27834.1 hypothetical protein APASM_0469 [Actinosynnema pretiosum subsp. pretiosum]QUF01475.1 DUF2537 domain-containing protein [Actinosynnema pretiosum subsp. pretiosum]
MELRVQEGRAVLAGHDGAEEREVDPRSLPLGAGLADALHEWAKVAEAVLRADSASEAPAGELVTRRGRQLAVRLAADMGTSVEFTDPVTGESQRVEAPSPEEEARGRHAATSTATGLSAVPGVGQHASVVDEPTPWGTGLTVTVFTAAVVAVTVVSLSLGLNETSGWLAVLANALVVGGISPSVWLGRKVPVWRWVSYGVVVGVVAAWVALLAALL